MPESHLISASGQPFPSVPELIFANWREALHASGFKPESKTIYALSVSGCLDYSSHSVQDLIGNAGVYAS